MRRRPAHQLTDPATVGRRRAAIRRALLGTVLVAGALVVATPTAEATTCVDPAGGGCAFTTIQAAVTAASAGDTITVVAGTFPEDVTITKALTLQGAQAGVDARTRSGAETRLRSVAITANDVTIDGFTFWRLRH